MINSILITCRKSRESFYIGGVPASIKMAQIQERELTFDDILIIIYLRKFFNANNKNYPKPDL
jgi:hypothetical protein